MTKNIFSRALHRASKPVFQQLRIDSLTFSRVAARKDLRRLGSTYGGWTIPTSLVSKGAICYCVGCGEDITFDLALIRQFGCDVFAFDPTPRAIDHVRRAAGNIAEYHFQDVGVWSKEETLKFFAPKDRRHVSHSLVNLQATEEYFEAKVSRLTTLMRANGHRRLDLLKLDVEGAEYAVIDSMLEDKVEVAVLCVEYDEFFSPLDRHFKSRIRASVAGLIDAGYVLVWSEGNGNYTFVNDGALPN